MPYYAQASATGHPEAATDLLLCNPSTGFQTAFERARDLHGWTKENVRMRLCV